MTTGSTFHMCESFVEDLFRMSVPQSKVAFRLRLNVLCWCVGYIRSVLIQYKRNRNGGRDDFLLKCNIGH